MKTQTLLLGEYASSAFYVYMIPSNNATQTTTDYLSIQDLYQLFFHHPPKDINPLIHTLYRLHPHHFKLDQKNRCYLAKHHVLTLARSLQLCALAEFCTLTHDELINRMADPLFAITNALMLRPVTPKRIEFHLDWFPLPAHSFSAILKSASRYLNADPHLTPPPPFFPPPPLQNDHSWSRHFLPLAQHTGITHRAQKQQQAVIECRQRILVLHQSTKKAKRTTAFVTPVIPQRKRKSCFVSDSQQRTMKKALYNDNLDLLATQATKMKGLPLSPEISPPPPPSLPPISSRTSFYPSPFVQSLPSIRNVLSDL